MSRDYEDAYEKGTSDFLAGAEITDNPYPPTSDQADAWRDGWIDVKEGLEK